MIPALFLVFSAVAYRVTSGLLIHSGASWLSNFAPLAAIALCSAAYFPKKYKFAVPLVTLFISDAVLNFRLAVSPFPEDAFAGFSRWIYNFLRDHERILVVKLSRLREKFGRAHSGAHGWTASVQRDAELDVFP